MIFTSVFCFGTILAQTQAQLRKLQLLKNSVKGSFPKLSYLQNVRNQYGIPDRDDIDGDLDGQLQFLQTHSAFISPSQKGITPKLVPFRQALFCFIPKNEISEDSTVKLIIQVQGQQTNFELRPPFYLPRADYQDNMSIVYTSRAWNVIIPYEKMTPGFKLKLKVSSPEFQILGAVESNNIQWGTPVQFVINNIRLGMLTDFPVEKQHGLIQNPVKYNTDYFTTLPMYKLTGAQYKSISLDKVICGNGQIYTVNNPDPSTAGVYDGRMRQDVGKAQFSNGINLATYGIAYSQINQKQPWITTQIVIHHSCGLYTSGRKCHGLSGGNGMGTLFSTIGNQLNHQVGHHLGLGHYPGCDLSAPSTPQKLQKCVQNMYTGWGYITPRKVTRGNIMWGRMFNPIGTMVNADTNSVYSPTFGSYYNFAKDGMAGGESFSQFSEYTMYCGFSSYNIQNNMKDKLVPDLDFQSGWKGWSQSQYKYVDGKQMFKSSQLRRPKSVAVPVYTILGAYTPNKPQKSLIYPVLYSNWGIVYERISSSKSDNSCWLSITYKDGSEQTEALKFDSKKILQINVNLDTTKFPKNVKVVCKSKGQQKVYSEKENEQFELDLPEPVYVGGKQQFSYLKKYQIRGIQKMAQDGQFDIIKLKLFTNSWEVDQSQVSDKAWSLLAQYKKIAQSSSVVTQILRNVQDLEQVPALDRQVFKSAIKQLGSQNLSLDKKEAFACKQCGKCVQIVNLKLEQISKCPPKTKASDNFFMDAWGRIRHSESLKCAGFDSDWYGRLFLRTCTVQMKQQFQYDQNSMILPKGTVNRALSFYSGISVLAAQVNKYKIMNKLPVRNDAFYVTLDNSIQKKAIEALQIWK